MADHSHYTSGDIPPPQPSKKNWLLIIVPLAVFGALAVLGLFVAGAFLALRNHPAFAPARPRPPAESLAEKRRANDEAFGKQGAAARPLDSDASAEELHELSALLERIPQKKTPEEVETCFDIERLYQEVQATASNQELLRNPDAFKGFRQGLLEKFASRPLLSNCVSSEIKRVKLLDGRDEAIVFSQHRTAQGVGVKMRWWVTRSRGKWRVYDLEDLSMGLRTSVSMASIADAANKQGFSPRQSEALQSVNAATALLLEDRYDEVEQRLGPTLDVPLPNAMAAWRFAQLAIVQKARENWKEVLELVDRSAAVNPDMPMLPMLRAHALLGLGRFEEGAAEARKYLTEVGADDHGSFLLGTALAGLGKKEEAADAFRQGLAAYANSVDNLVELASVLPSDEMGEIADRFAKFDRPAARFPEIAGRLVAKSSAAALEAVVARNREIAPRDPHSDYYQGELYFMREEYDQAAQAFGQAVPAMPESEQVDCQKALRNSLLFAGKPVEAYQAMPDDDDTFLSLCNHLVTKRDADGLDRLAELHAQRRPDDYWLPYFRGEAQMLRGEYQEAAATFRPMLTAPLPDGARSSYRDEYLWAEINAGHPLEAYRSVPDVDGAFFRAASRLIADHNPDDLEQLALLHAQRQPDDPYLTYVRGEVPRLRGEPAKAAAIFETLLDKQLPEDLRPSCFREYLRCMVDVGRPSDGYRAVPDAAFAFEFVSDLLLDRWDGADALEELIAAHEERLPEDPWLPYYRARLLIVRHRYREAAELLAPLVERTDDNRLKVELAEACRVALTYDGRPQEAYLASLNRGTGFDRTAAYLVDKLDAEKLAPLIATREGEQPDDPSLPYYRAQLANMGGDYRGVAALLTPAIASAEGELKGRMVRLLVDALYEVGDIKGACQAVGPEDVFNLLAARLADNGEADALEELLAEYQAQAADDPRLSYFRGRVAQLRGRADEAATAFSGWFKASADEEDGNSPAAYLDAMASVRRPLEAYQAVPDASVALAPLARELGWRGDVDLLEALLNVHAEKHADDPWLGYWRGRALLMRGKEDEALAAYTSVLRAATDGDATGVVACWDEYLIVGKPLDAYAIASAPSEAFEHLGENLLRNRDFGRLQQLVARHEPKHRDDPSLAWLKAELLTVDGKFAEAIELLKTRLADEESPHVYRCQAAHLKAVAKAGRTLDVYRAAEDKQLSFTSLASALYDANDALGLEALVDEHRKLKPNDPWLHFYAAQQLRLARKYDEADAAFAAALAGPEAGPARSSLTAARIESRLEAGKAVSAYEEIGPRLATLSTLVDLCRSRSDAAQLEQLIAAHRERYPSDARLKEWELEAASWKGDAEELLRSLGDARAPLCRGSQWRVTGWRVRALVRLNRFDEARALLDSTDRFRPAPFYRALVEGAAGNVPAATTALYNCLRAGSDVQDLYQDPELGKALRSDAFAGFRERHPESPPGDGSGAAGDQATRGANR